MYKSVSTQSLQSQISNAQYCIIRYDIKTIFMAFYYNFLMYLERFYYFKILK
jgi:hypothetical protein